jgi:hypothetical protein
MRFEIATIKVYFSTKEKETFRQLGFQFIEVESGVWEESTPHAVYIELYSLLDLERLITTIGGILIYQKDPKKILVHDDCIGTHK